MTGEQAPMNTAQMYRTSRRLLALCSLSLLVWGLPHHADATLIVEGTGGLQQTRLGWTIGVPGGPNILSELTFKSTAPKGVLSLRWLDQSETFFLDTSIGYGQMSEGTVRDDDFAGNNRQDMFSRSMSTIGGNSIQNYHVQGGWRFLKTNRIALAVTGGYRYDYYSFRITPPATQIVPNTAVNFDGLNAMYNPRWLTMTVGLEMMVPLRPLPMAFVVKMNYLPNVDYTGKGFWNMREEFGQNPSYKHKSKGDGLDLDLSLLIRWADHWHSTLGWQYLTVSTSGGTDQTFFRDGSSPTIAFNGADLRANYWHFSLAYRW